jgi:hypothetical protein
MELYRLVLVPQALRRRLPQPRQGCLVSADLLFLAVLKSPQQLSSHLVTRHEAATL